MKQQQLITKNKIYNHLMVNGNKFTCEKILFKNLKFLQKSIKKNHKVLVKSAIINVTPTIQLRQIKKKKRKSIKEFPYVLKKINRISIGIKNLTKKQTKATSEMIFQEIILLSKRKSEFSKVNETVQKPILLKKKYIFFRWFF